MPLEEILNDVLDGDAGSVGETPAESAETGQTEGPSTETAESAGTGEQAGEQGAGGEAPFRWENVPAELLPHVKHFQADYTRRMQELAEQRRAVEAQAQQYQAFAALEQLAQQDPALARQILAARLGLTDEDGQAAGGETADPFGTVELSETERLLAAQLQQQLAAQIQPLQQFYEQQMRQQARAEVDAAFDALARTIGREIPPQERQQIADFGVQHGILDPALAFKAFDYENALARARQAGLNQGAAVVQQKVGLAAPATTAERAGAVAEEPRKLEDVIAAAVTAAGL